MFITTKLYTILGKCMYRSLMFVNNVLFVIGHMAYVLRPLIVLSVTNLLQLQS